MAIAPIELLSVQTGPVALLPARGTEASFPATRSAIVKRPVSGPVVVGPLGIDGDEQADPTVHGGIDKAVYAYPAEHYAFWRQHTVNPALAHGALGENLTLRGLVETGVWIDDELRIGTCVFSVVSPRQPCEKLNRILGSAKAGKAMVQRGLTGWYLRVLTPGTLQAGDAVQLVAGPRRLSLVERQAQVFKRAAGD